MKITINNAKELYAAGLISYEEYRDVMTKGGVMIISNGFKLRGN